VFFPKVYDSERCEWICGCDQLKAFFCFPCLSFGGTYKFSKDGVRDSQKFQENVKTHHGSFRHLNNSCSLAILGIVNILAQQDSAYFRAREARNAEVSRNRQALSRIIDCIRFCFILTCTERSR
jgi:hypothetical protein